MRIDLPGGARLRPFEDTDAEELFALTDRHRTHLEPWLPWVPFTTGPVHSLQFIRMTRRQLELDEGMQLALADADGAIAGVAGFHRFDWQNRATSVGYWLAADRQGRGLMTAAVRALVAHGFDERDLHRIELAAAVENVRSRAVAERVGFREEGVRRGGERHGDRYLDLVVYALLATDPR